MKKIVLLVAFCSIACSHSMQLNDSGEKDRPKKSLPNALLKKNDPSGSPSQGRKVGSLSDLGKALKEKEECLKKPQNADFVEK